MTWFLFAGDMLVMAFMAGLAVWALWGSSDEAVEKTAGIPLYDERDDEQHDERHDERDDG